MRTYAVNNASLESTMSFPIGFYHALKEHLVRIKNNMHYFLIRHSNILQFLCCNSYWKNRRTFKFLYYKTLTKLGILDQKQFICWILKFLEVKCIGIMCLTIVFFVPKFSFQSQKQYRSKQEYSWSNQSCCLNNSKS